MGEIHSMCVGEKKCTENFTWKSWREETTS